MSGIEVFNLSPELFTGVPKPSHRPGPGKVPSLRALGLLTVLLSHKTGYTTTTEDIAADWAEGRGSVRTAMTDLEEVGYVYRPPVQGPDGKWRTRIYVSSDPATLDPIRAQYPKRETAKKQPPQTEADTAKPQVTPTTGFRSSVDRSSVDRAPVDRPSVVRSSKEETKKKTKQLLLPPPGADTPPQTPLTAVVVDDPGPDPTRSRAGSILAAIQRASGLPVGRMVRGKPLTELTGLLAGRLAAGWTDQQATDALGGKFNGGPVVGALRYRIVNNLDGEPPATPEPSHRYTRPWCGRCAGAERRRHVDPDTGAATSQPCPTCAIDQPRASSLA
jgi:hypothetical protein